MKRLATIARTTPFSTAAVAADVWYPSRYGADDTIGAANNGTGPIVGDNRVTANDDLLVSFMGVGTQIDGFGPLGIAHRYYNGNKAEDFVAPDGLKKFGTENIQPIATRGVLLDMTKLLGAGPVAPGTAFN